MQKIHNFFIKTSHFFEKKITINSQLSILQRNKISFFLLLSTKKARFFALNRAYLAFFDYKIYVFFYTNPENPIKAIANIPAVTKAMGTPCIALGTLFNANCSRIPANITNANVKPIAIPQA